MSEAAGGLDSEDMVDTGRRLTQIRCFLEHILHVMTVGISFNGYSGGRWISFAIRNVAKTGGRKATRQSQRLTVQRFKLPQLT
jgi:hypothetical protein